MSVLACYINILCRTLKPRESKRLQAAGQWSIGALGGDLMGYAAPSCHGLTKPFIFSDYGDSGDPAITFPPLPPFLRVAKVFLRASAVRFPSAIISANLRRKGFSPNVGDHGVPRFSIFTFWQFRRFWQFSA